MGLLPEESSARPGDAAGQRAQICLRGDPDAADRELNDPQVIRREILDLQRRLDDGLISEHEYDSAEAELLAHLDAITNERNSLCS